MKVVHLVWDFATGGIETMLADIIEEQSKLIDVFLIIVNNHITDTLLNQIPDNCHIYQLNKSRGSKNPISILKMNLILIRINPDIIHLHHGNMIRFVLPFWHRICTIHSTVFNPNDYKSNKIRYYAISDIVRHKAQEANLPNIEQISNGIPVGKIKVRLHNKSDVIKIIQVGRFSFSIKGQDLLLLAANELLNRRNIIKFEIHFVGYGPDEFKMVEMIKRYNLEKHVFIDGHKSRQNILETLCDYDLFIQSSRYEGFGLTLAEAMAAKLPVISSDVEGPLEILDSGRYGVLFHSNDYMDLVDKIEYIINTSYSEDLIEKAYRRVCSSYNIKNTALQYVDEYFKLNRKKS